MRIDESDDLLDKFLKGELEDIPNVSTSDPEGEVSPKISPENLEGIKSMFEQKRNREAVRQELVGMLHNRKAKDRPLYQTPWFRVAASVSALVLSALALYLINTADDQYGSIYEAYYKPFPMSSTTRGAEQSTASVIDLYEQEKYSKVITHFKYNSLGANEDGMNAILLGVSHLNTDQTERAITIFETIQNFIFCGFSSK